MELPIALHEPAAGFLRLRRTLRIPVAIKFFFSAFFPRCPLLLLLIFFSRKRKRVWYSSASLLSSICTWCDSNTTRWRTLTSNWTIGKQHGQHAAHDMYQGGGAEPVCGWCANRGRLISPPTIEGLIHFAIRILSTTHNLQVTGAP